MGDEAGKIVEGPGDSEVLEERARSAEGIQVEIRYSGLGN